MIKRIESFLRVSQNQNNTPIAKPRRKKKRTGLLEIIGTIGIPAVGTVLVVQQILTAQADRQ